MRTAMAAFMGVMALGATAMAQDAAEDGGRKILVAYFSRTNSTKAVAEWIHQRVGGDLFRVEPRTPYPQDYQETTRIAKAEQNDNARPELASVIPPETMREYDVVFVGYPCWWGTMPMAMFSFLGRYNFLGTTLAPFCTHGGSGMARSVDDLARLAPEATVHPGFAVAGSAAATAQDEVDAWLRRLGFIE